MAYQVIAPLVLAKNHEGADVYVYGPAPVPPGQSAEWIKRHLADGMIVEGDLPTAPDDDRPAGNASQDEWAAYAVAHGMTDDEVAGLSRNELRDRFQ